VVRLRLTRGEADSTLLCGSAATQCIHGASLLLLLHAPSITFSAVFRISQDNPAYYLTSVCRDRLHVFRTDRLKEIACAALDEARNSGHFLIFAYVIMPDHFHLVTSSELKVSEVQRYVNGITARRIISYLKEAGYDSSLRKLQRESGARQHR